MSDSRMCGNHQALMSYLYEDGDEAERRAFEAHLSGCEACAREVGDLRQVRTGLAAWSPPEQVLGFRIVREQVPPKPRLAWLRVPALPAWAQLAAASLVLGIAAGLAGLEIRYDAQGFTVRTGWGAPLARQADISAPAAPASAAASAEAPWRADLVALREQLQGEIRGQADGQGSPEVVRIASTPGRTMSDAEFLARMRELVQASEQRQQRELALRLSEVVRDIETQRRVDLTRVANSLGIVEGRTGLAVAEQRDMLNYLMRVSSRDQR